MNGQLSDTLVRRCEDASRRITQPLARIRPFNVLADKLERHIAVGGRHLEVWRDSITYFTTAHADAYCMGALFDLVGDEVDALILRTTELRALEAELRGVVGAVNSLPIVFTPTRLAGRTRIGDASNCATFSSPFTSSGYHTFHAPQPVRHVDP